MSGLSRTPSLFFAVPMFLGIACTLATFDLPPAYFHGIGVLVLLALLAIGMDTVLRIRLPDRAQARLQLAAHPREAAVALALGWFVIASCVVDLVAFPLPLLNPAIYADFSGGRSYVRHFSNLCWILPVIGIVCSRRTSVRAVFLAFGLLFPVLVLDRNRLFASMYSLLAVGVLFARQIPWKKILLGGVVLLVVFSQLGKLRSGNLEWVALPFSGLYETVSPGIKWILLYVAAGVYNFGAIEAKGYRNDDFLINQLIPGAGSVETLGSGIPFDEPTINVGTEYFPFLMAFGPVGVVLAGIGLYLGLVLAVLFFRRHTSPFTFLIFLRLSYVCLMAGFAPQAYTWTNFAFVILCVGLLVFSSMLTRPVPSREINAH